MTARFSAFSFVDRILELTPAQHAVGEFAVPAHVNRFPACLVAEAIGQLAAWVAMAHLEFRMRPVAALAGATHFHHEVEPGSKLVLNVELASCDNEGVAYSGSAAVDGVKVLDLFDCLGAMLPLPEFDDPAGVGERFALLRGAGALPGRFAGLDEQTLTLGAYEVGKSMQARLDIPQSAEFFGDHFPRKPVFPATLLLDAQIRLAASLMSKAERALQSGTLVPRRLRDMKVRAWILPGQRVDLSAHLLPREDTLFPARMVARIDGKTVATSRVEFGVGEAP